MTSLPRVSVIVPVWNDLSGISRCLDCLADQTLDQDRFEVLVVDNGSDPPVTLAGRPANVRLLREPEPGSYCARNSAIAEARGSVFAFTDADCLPQPEWLAAGLAALDTHDRPAFVGGRITVPGARPGLLSPVEAFEATANFNQERQIREMGCSATANLFVRRSVMEQVGIFGTAKSGGDYLWCKRAMACGVDPLYSDEALVYHPSRGSRSAVLSRERRLAGGHRDNNPGWGPALRFFLRHMVPPRRHILDIIGLPSKQIGILQKSLAVLFAIEARQHLAWMRLYLEVTGRPSPRA